MTTRSRILDIPAEKAGKERRQLKPEKQKKESIHTNIHI
jgi:hypothetical protein